MSRKTFICIFVLALASTTYATTPFLIGNFEDHNDGYRDWGNQAVYIDDPVMAGKYTYTTTGKTKNSKAVKVNAAINTWQQNLSIKSYESPYAGWPNKFVQGFLDNPFLAVDVTWVAADWVPANSSAWATIEMNIQGTNLGWEGMGRPDLDTGNPGYAGGWDPIHFGAVHTRTVYWDIRYLHDGDLDNKEITATGTSGYLNLIFQTNSGSMTSGGVYYFDNVRFVPEPATMALLGLGGLALIRRKR